MFSLNPAKMPEAEVSLRLALYLLAGQTIDGRVEVAIDGAQVRTRTKVHFPIQEFLAAESCGCVEPGTDWRGTYRHEPTGGRIHLHSTPGLGDVVARLRGGRLLRVECKKGPLIASKSSQEYPLIREALGQLLTAETVGEDDLLAAGVPESPRFCALAERWRKAPLIRRTGILILTVSREGTVGGFGEAAFKSAKGGSYKGAAD